MSFSDKLPPLSNSFPRHNWPDGNYTYRWVEPPSAAPNQCLRWAARVASVQWALLDPNGNPSRTAHLPSPVAKCKFTVPYMPKLSSNCFILALADKVMEHNEWRRSARGCERKVLATLKQWREDIASNVDEVYPLALRALPPQSPPPPSLASIRQLVCDIVDHTRSRPDDFQEPWPRDFVSPAFPSELIEPCTPTFFYQPWGSEVTDASPTWVPMEVQQRLPFLRESRRHNSTNQLSRSMKLLKVEDSARKAGKENHVRRIAARMGEMSMSS